MSQSFLRKRRQSYLKVHGIGIRDTVEVTAKRLGLKKVQGMVTGIAHGPGLETYFRVRMTLSPGEPTQSPWIRRRELKLLGDEMYHFRDQG